MSTDKIDSEVADHASVSAEAQLLVTETKGIGWITLNRPERRNALTVGMRQRFLQAVEDFDGRDEVRCIVVQGSNGSFCAGGDVAAQAERASVPISPARHRRDYLTLPGQCALALYRCRTPTLAAVDGPAAGAGASMALLCDIRVASRRAFLSVPFLDRGLVPDWLQMYVLPAYVGIGRAMDVFLLQERIDAERATQWGLFSSVHDEKAFPAAVVASAAQLSALPPVAVELMKAELKARLGDLPEMVAKEALAQSVCLATEDHREGAQAFLEKRRPRFIGR